MPAAGEIAALEDIERTAWRDVFAAAPPPLAENLGLRIRPWGRTLGFAVDHLPSLLFNRVLGLGEAGAACPWEEILAFYRGGAPAFALERTPAADDRTEDLAAADRFAAEAAANGFAPGLPMVKWSGDPRQLPEVESASYRDVREAQAAEAPVFGELMAAIFGGGAANALWTAATVGRSGWRLFFAIDAGQPVGTAALHLQGQRAWLGWGGVLPSHRGRGLQRQLLAARLGVARSAGCRRLTLETGQDTPEKPNPSYRNVEAAGYQRAYRRATWVWRAPGH